MRAQRPGPDDVLFIYREAMPVGPPVVERAMRRASRAMVYDIDDPIFFPPEGSSAWTRPFRDSAKWRTLCGLADVTLCINELIAERVRPHARRVEVMPNTVDVAAYAGERGVRRVPVLGYSGSHTTTDLMRSIEAPLRRLAQEVRLEVHVVGGRATIDIPRGRVVEIAWSAATERDILLGFDIGLAPATDTPWNRYKSFVKVLLYMASGLPVVASPVGLPAQIIRDGENGFLAATDDEWFERLRALIRDPALRRRLGAAAQETISRDFSPEHHLPRVQRVFLHVAGRD
jgi:glycosyltransferase involved in cell wall biosynthesis